MTAPDDVIRGLLERCRVDHQRWINGDAGGYELPAHGTILGAVGGHSFGGRDTGLRQAAVAAQWESGSGEIEMLNGSVGEELAWLTFIERATVFFKGDPVERRWDLRVTEVFARTGGGWERVHRHADPLVDRRPLPEVAGLQRAL